MFKTPKNDTENIVNFEDKEHIKELESVMDKAIEETKDNEEFEAFKELEKDLNRIKDLPPKYFLEATDQLKAEILKVRLSAIDAKETAVDIQNAISKKRQEQVDTLVIIVGYFHRIEALLEWIKKHVSKWFWSILILASIFMFISGGLANENKEIIYPLADKAIQVWEDFRKVKNISGIKE